MDKDIDPDVGLWILEFILRQPLKNRLLISLTDILPLPNDISSLKKMLLVRIIEVEISKGCVSENILDFLEQIEELDYQNGIEEQSVLIRDAYCAVAVTCTVSILADNGIVGNYVYFEAVKRIWRGKVSKLEERKVGLISEELLRWKDDIEAALWEKSFIDKLLKRSEGMDAIGAVRAYVDEVKGKMGPSFLEFVAQTMKTDDTLRELLCNAGNARRGKAGGEVEKLPRDADQELGLSNGKTELNAKDSLPLEGHKEIVLSRRKHVAMKRVRGTRGVKIAYTDNSTDDECKKCDLPLTSEVDKVQKASKSDLRSTPEVDEVHEAPKSSKCGLAPTPEVEKVQEALKSSKCVLPSTPEVEKAQEALKSSSSELQAVVKDPLPDALLTAESLISVTKRGNTSKVPVEESQIRENPPVAESSTAVQANIVHVSSHGQEVKNKAPKPSLIERNSTACTLKWEDSIDGTPEDSPNGSRVQLPSPKRRLVSPLKNCELPDRLRKRRKIKRWSTEEEDTLRSAVQKYGCGNWKFILNAYRDIFEERTEVDLKDKWRNMTRYIRP